MIVTNHNVAVLCPFEPSTLISPQVENVSAAKDTKESTPKAPKVCAPEEPKKTAPKDPKESAPENVKESPPQWTLRSLTLRSLPEMNLRSLPPEDPKEFCFKTLDNMVDNLVTSLQNGDHKNLTVFLCTYPTYTTIQ